MADIALAWTDSGADIQIDNTGLVQANELQTAILVSLFSDARASSDQAAANDLRGWWSDYTNSFGSLLWLLEREKLTNSVIETARDYAKKSLTWLITEGIASEVTVQAEAIKPSMLYLRVLVSRGSNKRYDYAWETIKDVTYVFEQTSLVLIFE